MPPTFTVRAARAADYADIAHLVAHVFGEGDPDLYRRIMHSWIFYRPRAPKFDYQSHRIGLLTQGNTTRLVTHAGVTPYTLRYGGARLRVGGVHGVCTHPDARAQGYAAAVMHDALAYMAEQGAHLALLHSAPDDYYQRFGFNPVLPYYRFEFSSAAAAQLPAGDHTLRPAHVADVPFMAALYERHWAWRVAFTRAPELWLWRVRDGTWLPRVVQDADGRIVGYTAEREPCSERTEVVADTPGAALALLADAGARWSAQGHAHVRWLLPPDDALIASARQHVNVTVSAHYRAAGGWMARLIDTGRLVDALLGELRAQATATRPDFPARALALDVGADVVQIGLRGEPGTFSALDHQAFIELLFGTLRPAALALRGDVSPAGAALLEMLFPPRVAALAPWDWF